MVTATEREASFLGAPSFFRAGVSQAQSRTAQGINPDTGKAVYWDYESVGYSFCGLLNSGDLSGEAFKELKKLSEGSMTPHQFGDEILGFITREFPGCIRLIPSRRRHQFLKGVIRAMAESRCDVESSNAERLAELYAQR